MIHLLSRRPREIFVVTRQKNNDKNRAAIRWTQHSSKSPSPLFTSTQISQFFRGQKTGDEKNVRTSRQDATARKKGEVKGEPFFPILQYILARIKRGEGKEDDDMVLLADLCRHRERDPLELPFFLHAGEGGHFCLPPPPFSSSCFDIPRLRTILRELTCVSLIKVDGFFVYANWGLFSSPEQLTLAPSLPYYI